MIKEALKTGEEQMRGAVQSLEDDLARIRTGRANPALVERISVDYYGMPTPLNQLASISVPEPRQLLIRPFDPGSLSNIERAILASDLGLTPSNDGHVVRLILPMLTEERRRELVKVVGQRVEEARVAVRNVRRDVLRELRQHENDRLISEDDLKRGENDLQDLTDRYIDDINKIGERKEKEILGV
ncbi:MAG: ribosome recycling factor [Chloroflexota bacterium]